MGQERIITRLLVTFGGFALLLACSGLHGVTSYSVARRTNEIGIRVAGYHFALPSIWWPVRVVLPGCAALTLLAFLIGLRALRTHSRVIGTGGCE